MLQTHTIDPEDPASSAGQALYTITAGGFSATADAFARDEQTEGLWFVSMVGSQTALKAIWASLLKQPPDVAHIIKGADGTWTTKDGASRRLPAVHHPVRDHRHLDDQDRPPAGDRRLARTGVHQDRGVRIREGLLPPAGAVGGGGPGSPSPVPRQAQPAAPARLLGRLALAAGPGTKRRSFRCSRWASRPTGAPPRPRSCGKTCPTPWRRAG